MSVAPHWYSPSRYMAACHGQDPGLELVPPTILSVGWGGVGGRGHRGVVDDG